MRQQLALVPREQPRAGGTRAASAGRSSPSTVTARFSRSTSSSPTSTHRLACGLRPPERRAQAREQLVDPERLRDVVVGAGVERRDLLALVADDREDEHGASLQPRSSRQTSTPLPSGSTRSRMTASGGRSAAVVSASSPRRRRLDLVARAAQGRLERAQDLRLVVDDEDRASRSRGYDAAVATGSDSTNAAPFRGDSAPQACRRSPARSPRAIASPSPLPAARDAPRARTARRCARARRSLSPGPWSTTRTTHVAVVLRRRRARPASSRART